MKQLKDTDRMTFGMHTGAPMQDVPASYFHYLWVSGKKQETKSCPVADYIKRNLHHLKKEHPDGIWS